MTVDQAIGIGHLTPKSSQSPEYDRSPVSSINSLPDFSGDEKIAPELYVDTLNNLKPSPSRPLDWEVPKVKLPI
jgi:hypothetical protein